MSKYAYSQQGACSLKIFSDNILLRSMAIERAGWKLEEFAKESGDSIGVFKDNIIGILESHRTCLRNFSDMAHDVADLSNRISSSLQYDDMGYDIIIRDYVDSLKDLSYAQKPQIHNENDLYTDNGLDFPRNVLNIYFIVETSCRMPTTTLDVFKNSIYELFAELHEMAINYGIIIKAQLITYNISAKLINNEPIPIDDFIFPQIDPFGPNNFGEACKKVSSIICLDKFRQLRRWPGLQPIVFHLIASDPNDDYTYGAQKLRDNFFFQKHCQKFVWFIGDKPTRETYLDILGTEVSIVRTFPYDFQRKIKINELKEDWFVDL